MNTRKYCELKNIYEELCGGEKIIKEKLNSNKISHNDEYETYGVLDKGWVKRYKKYLIDYLNSKSKQEFNYNVKELIPKTEEKIFCMINGNDDHTYYFLKSYVLVTSYFISLISKYFNHNEVIELNKRLYGIFIGGKCIIRKDKHNYLDHYITLLYDENDDNFVDFILNFESQKNMIEHLDFILKNDFFFIYRINKIC